MNAPSTTRTTPTSSMLRTEIPAAFQGQIEPVTRPWAYRAGILLVAVVMVLLPLVYLALIAAVAYGVFFYMTNATGVLSMGRGRGQLFVFLMYFAPLIIGGILVLFMLKPLLSRPATQRKSRSVSQDDEPLLWAFVDRICEAVRSPKPRRIDIDCEVNASASFRRGLWSMLGNDLVLTIGLPLVAGLNLRQLGGVLAHEFGHFSQGAGMRLTYVIRMISFWFTRVVYERDSWDESLISWSRESDLRFGWIFYIARGMVWLTRRVLWVLMRVGQAVSGFMLRQMEFDADRHEARLAGSEAFESTARQLWVLNFANRGAQSDLSDFYREGRLGDNLPKLILHNVSQFTPDVLAKINGLAEESKTGWLDTHPCDQERIASARQEHAPGIFRLERPASVLFADFDALSRAATMDFYLEIFQGRLNPADVHPIASLLARQEQEAQAFRALRRFFQNAYSSIRPVRLKGQTEGGESPAARELSLDQLGVARQQMLDALPGYQAAFERFSKVSVTEEARLEPELAPFEAFAGQRLATALQAIQRSQIADAILPDAAVRRHEAQRLLDTLEVLDQQIEPLRKLHSDNAVLMHFLEKLMQGDRGDATIGATRSQMAQVAQAVSALRNRLTSQPYPFDHAKGSISIGEYLVAQLPDADNPGAIASAADDLLSKLTHLRARVVGQLCVLAEAVETALGLPPLPEPREDATS